ncbi:MAG: sugar transferase [Candidatus Doudnabacteria bacterium]|nr:sugar transferase [Candidatus Doudnabacteria bacterium]
MKRSELAFNIASLPMDATMLLLAGIASFHLRQKSTNLIGPILYKLQIGDFVSVVVKVLPILILIFAGLGLYNLRGTRRLTFEFGRIFIGVSLGLLIIILLFFFDRTIFPSRFIILATWGTGIVFVSFGRLLLRDLQKYLFFRDIGLHRLVIIHAGHSGPSLIEEIFKNKSYGYKVIKEVSFNQSVFLELDRLYKSNKIDEILQADPALSENDNFQLVEYARNKGLAFSLIPSLFDSKKNVVETANFNGIPVISLKNTPLDGWGKVAKRIIDIFASLICLILASPLFLAIAAAIKLDSKGKIVYGAIRGGKNKDFTFYKFRTMYSHLSVGEDYGGKRAEEIRNKLWEMNTRGDKDAPFLKVKHDPRVTKLGRFLRKTKLDEIPQFFNVLKGDMSMVGPRAHVVEEVERYREAYRRMFSVKPGIFGLSQISQIHSPNLSFEEEIRLNTYYIENWSLWLDFKILFQSFRLLFFAKKSQDDY